MHRAIALVAAAAISTSAAAQQPADPSGRLREITPAMRPDVERAIAYASDAAALNQLLTCPSTREGNQRAAIRERISQLRGNYLKAEGDPYWHGYADAMITRAIVERALAMAADINARRPPDAWTRNCAEAAARLAQILLR